MGDIWGTARDLAARVLVGIAQGDGGDELHEMIDALAGVVLDAPAVVLAEGLLEQPEDRFRFARATELAAIVLGVSDAQAPKDRVEEDTARLPWLRPPP